MVGRGSGDGGGRRTPRGAVEVDDSARVVAAVGGCAMGHEDGGGVVKG